MHGAISFMFGPARLDAYYIELLAHGETNQDGVIYTSVKDTSEAST